MKALFLFFSFITVCPSYARSDECVQEANDLENLASRFTVTSDFRAIVLNPGARQAGSFEQLAEMQIETNWVKRVSLRNKWISGKNPTRECAEAVGRAFRALRAVEDYYYFIRYQSEQERRERGEDLSTIRTTESMVHPLIYGSSQYLLIPPGIYPALLNESGSFHLRSGDLILTRGDRFTSAVISNLGTNPHQFSHLMVIYQDESTGQFFSVESLIESGSHVFPLEERLKRSESGRMMIFRHPNFDLAARAAKKIYDQVKSRELEDRVIPYDFAFDLSNDEALFCSELAHVAFDFASGGEIKLPRFPSHLQRKNSEIRDGLGIPGTEGFLPADMEIEPSFKIVAEWRNPAQLKQIWTYDSVARAIQRWFDDFGYRLAENVLYDGIGFLESWLHLKTSEGMPAKTISTVGKLNDLSKLIFDRLTLKEDQMTLTEERYQKGYGLQSRYPLTPHEQDIALDEIREEDLTLYCNEVKKPYSKGYSETLHSLIDPESFNCTRP